MVPTAVSFPSIIVTFRIPGDSAALSAGDLQEFASEVDQAVIRRATQMGFSDLTTAGVTVTVSSGAIAANVAFFAGRMAFSYRVNRLAQDISEAPIDITITAARTFRSDASNFVLASNDNSIPPPPPPSRKYFRV